MADEHRETADPTADPTTAEAATAHPATADLPGRSRRTPPLIDGEVNASEIIVPAEPAPVAEPDVSAAGELPPDVPPPADPLPPPVAEAAPSAPLPPPRAALWPVGAGLVLGALIAVAGAFGLQRYAAPPASPGPSAAQVAALSARLDALEKQPVAASPGAPAKIEQAVSALSGRVSAVETVAKNAAAAAGSAESDARAALAAASSGASAAAPAPPAAPPVDLTPLESQLAALEKRLAPLETALADTKTQIRATQDRDAAALQQGTRAPALAITAQSLLRNVEGGTPFASQLAAMERLGGDPARIAALRPFADKGVPSPAQLAAAFAAATEAAGKTDAPAPNAGLLAHIEASAARLVQVRKLGGAATGTDLRSQILTALQKGDVAGALALWDAAPPDLKTPSQDWAMAAKGRIAALAAAHAIDADAVAALGKGKS